MFDFITRKLSVEVVLLILMIGVTPALIVGLLSLRTTWDIMAGELNREIAGVRDTAANTTMNYFRDTARLADSMAQNQADSPIWISLSKQEAQENAQADETPYDTKIAPGLKRFSERARVLGIRRIYFFKGNTTPELIYPKRKPSNPRLSNGAEILFSSAKRAMRAKAPYWMEKPGAANRLILSVPIIDENIDEPLGVMVLEIGAEKLLQALEAISLPAGLSGVSIKGDHFHLNTGRLKTTDLEELSFKGDERANPQSAGPAKEVIITKTGDELAMTWETLDSRAIGNIRIPGSLRVAAFSDRMRISGRLTGLRRSMIVAGALACVAMCALGFFFVRPMVKPVLSVAGIAQRVTKDDYSDTEVDSSRKDEIGVMVRAFKQMVENLKVQRRSTLEGVSVLAASASEITATASQLSSVTSRTSSAVSETTTTAEEVKQAAMVSSDKAKDVAENAKKADKRATSGLEASQDMSRRVATIKNQMKSINEAITGLTEHRASILNTTAVVANIAEQSNLLAVNAAIEAVRAGEHGHGFGVVAQEIKALADQSKQAATKVNSILNDAGALISAAEDASDLTNEAIVAGVRQSELVQEVIESLSASVSMAAQDAEIIEASSEQQFVGMDQLAQAMANIESAMSQSMSAAEQLESEAQKLQELGETLKGIIEFHG
jgi:methyl-accepting chemotaxis protein